MFSNNRVVSDGVFELLIATLALAGLVEFYGWPKNAGSLVSNTPDWSAVGLLMLVTFAHFQGWLGIHGPPSRVNDFETGFLDLICAWIVCAPVHFQRRRPQGSRPSP